MTASVTIDHETKTIAFTCMGTPVELYRLLAKELQSPGQEVPRDLGLYRRNYTERWLADDATKETT